MHITPKKTTKRSTNGFFQKLVDLLYTQCNFKVCFAMVICVQPFFQCAWVVIIHSANTLLHIPKKKRKQCLFILLWILKVIEDVLKCLKNKTVSGRLHIFQWAKEIEVVFAYFSHYILNCISSIKLPTRPSAWNFVKIGCRKKKNLFFKEVMKANLQRKGDDWF